MKMGRRCREMSVEPGRERRGRGAGPTAELLPVLMFALWREEKYRQLLPLCAFFYGDGGKSIFLKGKLFFLCLL